MCRLAATMITLCCASVVRQSYVAWALSYLMQNFLYRRPLLYHSDMIEILQFCSLL